MGQCGCGDFHGDFKFKGPGEIVYVGQFYHGCDYCGTPAGLVIYAFGPDDHELWGCDEIPEIEINDCGTGFGIIDAKELAKNLDAEDDFPDIDMAFKKAVWSQVDQEIKRINAVQVKESHKR